ncbi:MAG TPA: HlyD family efflux transporter periplasmic adaptor subunit [Rhizomicrobium sp.]|nr:HlyD family efflux transporter periplasmic adaptor subunit [Rhizomicrobium sp.]
MTATSDIQVADIQGQQRRFWFLILGGVILAAAIAYGAYWLLYARNFESTDDAYVGGNVVAVTSKENATVLALHADNTQTVKQGQLLIEMDPAIATVNLQAAQANLARVVRGVKAQFSKSDSGEAQLNQARVALAQAQDDYARRQKAFSTQSVSGEELAHARDAVAAARAAVNSAQGGLQQTNAGIEGTDIAHNPEVMAAEAQLRAAAIAYGHMRIIAPLDGVIAQRTVQAGQQVAAGTPLMAVVPLSHVWIDANFKEVQLARMRVGQPVTVKADIYGGGVAYHGHIEGLGAGSGSAFALLPPQNASGNWIKIVQRVPVRIALDPEELAKHPLRVGLSVTADADVRDQSGPLVTSSVGTGTTRANTGEDSGPAADAIIARILKENAGALR